MTRNFQKQVQLCRQRGNTLVLILMFLSLMAMMGLTAMQGSTLQERMAGNLRDRSFAMQAAEDALRIAEAFAQAQAGNDAAFDGSNQGLYDAASNPPDPFDDPAWEDDATLDLGDLVANGFITNQDLVSGVDSQPSFYIQYLGKQPLEPCYMGNCPATQDPLTFYIFLIMARGTGLSNNSVVVLESYYAAD